MIELSPIFAPSKRRIMKIERFILTRLLNWELKGDFPDVRKSVLIFAPHTSHYDAVIGKLVLCSYGVPHTLLSKKELFNFPMNIVMHILGAIPVGGVKGHNAIHDAASILNHSDEQHLVICPEGQLAPTDRWNPGFYYIALKANVPIIVGYLDFGKREAGVKAVIRDLDDKNEIYRQMAEMYAGVKGFHPERFELPKYIS